MLLNCRLTLAVGVVVSITACSLAAFQKSTNAKIANKSISESSGLAFSTRSDDLLYTHNDSGDRSRLFVIDRNGSDVCELEIEGAANVDWEDMCSFVHRDENWLAIGDVGDNGFLRSSIKIYLVREPKIKKEDQRQKTKVDVELTVRYPDGPINCESLAYDSTSNKLLLLTKETLVCRIYSVDVPDSVKGKHSVTATYLGKLPIPLATGADVSRDGRYLAIATYGPVCLIPRREGTLSDAWKIETSQLQKLYLNVPPRKQGESVCFSPDGKKLWLTSEIVPSPLIEFAIPER